MIARGLAVLCPLAILYIGLIREMALWVILGTALTMVGIAAVMIEKYGN